MIFSKIVIVTSIMLLFIACKSNDDIKKLEENIVYENAWGKEAKSSIENLTIKENYLMFEFKSELSNQDIINYLKNDSSLVFDPIKNISTPYASVQKIAFVKVRNGFKPSDVRLRHRVNSNILSIHYVYEGFADDISSPINNCWDFYFYGKVFSIKAKDTDTKTLDSLLKVTNSHLESSNYPNYWIKTDCNSVGDVHYVSDKFVSTGKFEFVKLYRYNWFVVKVAKDYDVGADESDPCPMFE